VFTPERLLDLYFPAIPVSPALWRQQNTTGSHRASVFPTRQIGTARRRFFYGPRISNFDLALKKDLRLSESKSLQFRLEAFNVFNHTQFYGPAAVNGNISSADFWQVVSAAPPRLIQLAGKFLF
jgi:hypothetical protein